MDRTERLRRWLVPVAKMSAAARWTQPLLLASPLLLLLPAGWMELADIPRYDLPLAGLFAVALSWASRLASRRLALWVISAAVGGAGLAVGVFLVALASAFASPGDGVGAVEGLLILVVCGMGGAGAVIAIAALGGAGALYVRGSPDPVWWLGLAAAPLVGMIGVGASYADAPSVIAGTVALLWLVEALRSARADRTRAGQAARRDGSVSPAIRPSN